MRRPLLAVVLALVAALGVLVAPSSPALAADEVVVTWPSVTAFNPDITTYEVTIDDPVGTGVLMAWWQDEPGQVVDGDGTTALTFDKSGVGVVLLTRCPAASATYPGQCWGVDQSAELSVYDHLVVEAYHNPVTNGGSTSAGLSIAPAGPYAEVTGAWSLLNPRTTPTTVLATGELPTGAMVVGGRLRFPVEVPLSVPSGTYLLRVEVHAVSSVYGELAGSSVAPRVYVDRDAPVVTIDRPEPSTDIFPIRDGYHDRAIWELRTTSPYALQVEVRNAAGAVVFANRRRGGYDRSWYLGWDGRSATKALAPEGDYQVVMTVEDYAGNATVVSRPVHVSHLVRREMTFTRTVSASASLAGKSVGACSSLRKKAGGALLLASQTRCRADDRRATVVTSHGMYLPVPLDLGYGSFQITMRGRPGGGSGGTYGNYVVMGYLTEGKKFANRREFRSGTVHRGDLVRDSYTYVFDRKSTKPYLIWTTGLSSGSRYVVSKFTVRFRYVGLTRPGARRTVSADVPQRPLARPRAASYL